MHRFQLSSTALCFVQPWLNGEEVLQIHKASEIHNRIVDQRP